MVDGIKRCTQVKNETGSVVDTSGDVIVMSSECREVEIETLDKIRMTMWEINP